MAFLGPVMWGSLALDLALKAIGTDYARVVRAVYILAQASGRAWGWMCVLLCGIMFRGCGHVCLGSNPNRGAS